MKLMQFYIRKEQKEELEKLAKKQKISMATLIREAIDLWLRRDNT